MLNLRKEFKLTLDWLWQQESHLNWFFLLLHFLIVPQLMLVSFLHLSDYLEFFFFLFTS